MDRRRWSVILALLMLLLLVPLYVLFGPGTRAGNATEASSAASAMGPSTAEAATVPVEPARGFHPPREAAATRTARQGARSAGSSTSDRLASAPQGVARATGEAAGSAGDPSDACEGGWSQPCASQRSLLDDTLPAGLFEVPTTGPVGASSVLDGSGSESARRRGALGLMAGLTGGGVAVALSSGGTNEGGGTNAGPTGSSPQSPSSGPDGDPVGPGPTTPVPEPVTGTLLAIGLAGWAGAEVRRRRGAAGDAADADEAA